MKSFNKDRYRSNLQTSWLGSDLLHYEELPSTNSLLKKLGSEEFAHGTVLIADDQTEGRGQYKRAWDTEKYKNLTFTMAFKPSSGARLPLLTLGCALGILRVLESEGIENCRIKWPNDLLVDGKKICGLLTESVFLGSTIERVIVGIGLNVNQKEFVDDLAIEPTSVAMETGGESKRDLLLCKLLSEIEHIYTRWSKQDPELCKDINQRMIGFGEWVSASLNGVMSGERHKFLGINSKGECVMLNEELDVNIYSYEQIRVFPSGREV